MQLSCQSNLSNKINVIANLPKLLKESSGIENIKGSANFWLINDAGNSNDLFEIDDSGNIIRVIEVKKAKNKDWEDLATDGKNKIFIGDFGNNENDRQNLRIYSVSINEITDNVVTAEKISFHFEDQTKFPPKKKNQNFDVEAFVYMDGYFYLFTKNRSSHFDGITKLYKIPNVKGKHTAKLIGEFITCNDSKTCLVTGAAISKNNKKLVLLTHNKLFEFTNFKKDDFFNGSIKEIDLNHNSQKEAICFKRNELFITDEFSKKTGGNLYKVKN
jgi:hypothetical protein